MKVHALHLKPASPIRCTVEDLQRATNVAQQVQDMGGEIITAHHNGRSMVLHLDRKPALDIESACIRRVPAPAGVERTYAGTHLGVQLQWTECDPAEREVCHG